MAATAAARAMVAGGYPAATVAASVLLLLVLTLVLVTDVKAMRGEPKPVEKIAAILTEFVHACTPPQCAMLRAISHDDNATAAERTLATILLLVDHRPDPANRPRLQALQQACNPAPVRTLARVLEHLVHIPAAADRAELFELLQGGSDVGPGRSASTR
jgi:hypothetical protein